MFRFVRLLARWREMCVPSRENSSPCCQGTFPRPAAYEATKRIIDSRTSADHVVEYIVPSTRFPPVFLVKTVTACKYGF